MSHEGSDNHFVSARERDLRPLLEDSTTTLELNGDQVRAMETFLGEAWLSGTRSGHAKLMKHARRCQEDPGQGQGESSPVDADQLQCVEGELRSLMEVSGEALALPSEQAPTLWDYLSKAWTAGVQTYETEVMASLIERKFDVTIEMQRWLQDNGSD